MIPSPLAQFDPAMIGFIVPVASLIFVVAIIAIKKNAETQRQKLWHETARIALEKGQPVPFVPPASAEGEKKQPQNSTNRDVRAGLILLSIGAALYLGSKEINFAPGLFAFYIPTFIGVALLLNAVFSFVLGKKQDNNKPSSKA